MSEHQQMQQSKNPEPTFQKQVTPASQTYESNPSSIIQHARINPKSLSQADFMQLQCSTGNRATAWMKRNVPEVYSIKYLFGTVEQKTKQIDMGRR